MTDLPSSHKTHTAPVDSIAGLGLGPSSVKLAPTSKSNDLPVEDEEDYTIKCICGFQDDDGNTVLCEQCETWQHILCYYFRDGIVLDVKELEHSCADCKPRPLDAQGAVERQSKRRDEFDPRKIKKTATKSHKKKVKNPEPNIQLTNGWSHDRNDLHDCTSRSPRDALPNPKRPKANHHRHSGSIGFPSISSNSAFQAVQTSGSCRTFHSPTQIPDNQLSEAYTNDLYSLEFLHLYDNDPGDAPMQANLFNDITITDSLSSWSHEIESLREAANGLTPQDVFHRCDQPLDSMTLPHLRKECKQDVAMEIDGRHPRWNFLTIDSLTPKGSIVGELRGKIGHMQDYVKDPSNRWDYLRHPVPFVFFHPKLPIYIDTRSEGTTCRYLRRGCCPNLSMKTILENGSDYRFCFVAKDNLEPGTELTIGWVLDEHIRNFISRRNSDESKQEGVDAEEDYVSDWVGKVLADFGGCACGLPNQCALARYDRRNSRSSHSALKHLSNGKPTKGRNGYLVKLSPPSTGYATNSRAGSEAFKHFEDEENDDNRSASESARSKPQSRDLTPTHRTSDNGTAPGAQLSDREKRKIAALEKNFELLEQDRQQPALKKKKRNSGSSNLNTPTVATSVSFLSQGGPRNPTHYMDQRQLGHSTSSLSQPNTPGLTSRPRHADANTFHQKSISPVFRSLHTPSAMENASPASSVRLSQNGVFNTSTLPRSVYVNNATQTDVPESTDWYEPIKSGNPRRRPYISLTKRLLIRCQRDRERLDNQPSMSYVGMNEKLECTNPHPPEKIVKEPDGVDPMNLGQCDSPEDTEMRDAEPQQTSRFVNLSLNAPVQKPRPPDYVDVDSAPAVVMDVKHPQPPPPPPPPSSLRGEQLPVLHSRPPNGYHSPDLRLDLPQTPQLLGAATLDTSVVASKPVTTSSPLSQASHISLQPLSTTSSALTQPSPVKKKMSLVDYKTYMKKKVSYQKAEALSLPEKGAYSSEVLPQDNIKKPNMDGEIKVPTTEGSIIVKIPNKDDDSTVGGQDLKS